MISTLIRSRRRVSTTGELSSKYKDLFFDLASCVTFDASSANKLFHSALKNVSQRLHREFRHQKLGQWERATLVRLYCQEIRKSVPALSPHFANREQLELDAASTAAQRLKRLSDFFKLLPRDEKIILALKDRHQISVHEISVALQIPEESVHYRYSRAIAALESQIWRPEVTA